METLSANEDVIKAMDNIIHKLKRDSAYYESDYFNEYTQFEESLKDFCDNKLNILLENKEYDVVFNILVNMTDTICKIETNIFYEDLFRPVELITYYFAKLAYLSDDMKDNVYGWMIKFIEKYPDTMISFEYFKPFTQARGIYHSDEYYTDYDDFDEVILIFKNK